MRIALAVVALLAVRVLAQPSVTLAPKFVAGESARYALDAELGRRRGSAADAPGVTLRQQAEFRANVVSIAADGSATVRLVFEKLRVELSRTGESPTSWTWAQGQDEGVLAGPEVARLPEVGLALANSVVELRVERNGWVRRVDGLERAVEAALDRRGGEPAPAPLLGVFDPGSVEHTLSGLWAVGPERAEAMQAKVGDTWEAARRAPFFADYQAESVTTYRLERVEADRAEISGEVRYAIIPPKRDVDPGAPVPRLTEQSGRASVVWDAGAGRLVSRRLERVLAWEATIRLEKPIEVRDHTTAKLEFRLLD